MTTSSSPQLRCTPFAVVEAGAPVVAIDGTGRRHPNGLSLAETIAAVHERSDALVMADCSTFDEGVAATAAGADLVGTTLAGHTAYTTKGDGLDVALVRDLARFLGVPVITEGRIHTPARAANAIGAGAHAIVVGSAITQPTTITGWFAAAVATPHTSDQETS